jgi:hypothetical protein
MNPPVRNVDGYQVYAMEDVLEVLGPARFALFVRWLDGQTLTVLEDGRDACFERDYRHFVASPTPVWPGRSQH